MATEGRQSRPLSRRAFMRLAGAAAASATLAACSPTLSSRASRDGKVQLVYQDWRTDWFPEMAQQMLEEFHETHPNIQVFYTPDPENLLEQMPLDMESGTAPDVLAGCCDWLPAWGQQGYLLDLAPYVRADLDRDTIEEWDPAQYRALFTPDGLQFALPKYHGALALYYNKGLFDARRVDYPDASWDHEDYLAAMKRVCGDRNRAGVPEIWGSMMDVAWDRIQVHVNAWGGRFVNPADATRSMMAMPPSLEAMEWIRGRMWDDRLMASFLDVQNVETRRAFVDSRIAMVEDGSWALKDILAGANFSVGVAPMPAGPVRRATLATTDGFAIYSGTRYPEAAWELVKFLISREYGLAMARANFLQPARASLIDQWVEIVRREFATRTRDVDIAVFADGHLNGYSVTAEVFANQAEASRLARAAWQQIFTLGQAPVDLMREVSSQIEALQKPRREG
ncbi:MAG: sugar ABC transporter substrate-binding protein [Anaerolineaceae bacterium]|nr:sugar ABC transporter substrate-binding protein [Anaerolineaceae bacterium]